jgi:hypothetical protein
MSLCLELGESGERREWSLFKESRDRLDEQGVSDGSQKTDG